MSKHVKTWAPTLRENDEPTMSLLVACGIQPPTLETYKYLLELALVSLIQSDPKQARRDIREVSVPDSPGLSFLLSEFEPPEWAVQIMLSPQMTMLLHRIDWQRISPVQERPEEELPSLMDILQMLP